MDNMQDTTRVNRQHKDRLFRFIFHDKQDLLSLYNAINGSDYANPDDLIIYTMEDYVYMGMKNDLSFLIDWNLNIFEHQSTYNPNMPLRGLFYVSASLKKYVELNNLDIYSSKQLVIPIPRYYVFYNGTQKMDDEVKIHLTDSMCGDRAQEQSCVQFVAHMININAGHNPKIMEKCPKLYEYSVFVEEVRRNKNSGMELTEAINKAVDTCIRKGILADILRANRAEVTTMIMKEYDEALHISNEKEISYESGFAHGQLLEKENTEKERQRADLEAQRADLADQKVQIFTYHFLQGKTVAEIAELMQLPTELIEEMLSIS